MNNRDKFYANERREAIFQRDGYTCRICGLPIRQHGTPQLAHRIAQTKANIKRYGKEVIHHDDNLWSTCSLECNARAMVNHSEAEELAESIRRQME